ncbi:MULTISPECIES: response regulator [Myxococcaceae]|uniref:response regulator n=1 Tax=Myxococcaceae TaxID=31 RepID=UPI00188E2A3C|nr:MULTISPECIES: response regulator [Myxococcaceae]MBF5045277.1 response regulator [Simulacricoccus sp. 17bor-14]
MPPNLLRPLALIVEDDVQFGGELQRLVRGCGWEAEWEPDGLIALGRLALDPVPQLLLLDVELPGLSGWSLYGEMMASARLPKVPAVVITKSIRSYSGPLAGILDYLQKPTTDRAAEAFTATLKDHLRTRGELLRAAGR